MSTPLLDPYRAQQSNGPVIVAVALMDSVPRETAAHDHARGQLLGATRGLLSVGTGEAQWVVPAINAVWIPPHHPHSLRSHGPFAGWSVYVDEVSCALLPEHPCAIRTSGLLREAVSRAAGWGEGSLNAPQSRIAGVILDEIQGLPREQLGLPMPKDARLLRISQALADNLADNRHLEAWAEWAGISSRTLTRRFTAETGFSFAAWRQRARLMRALELLAAGIPVTTVALELGYENISTFIDMFRQHIGVTPSRYAATLR